MEELTTKQVNNRWVEIKKQIKERQLLAFRVGIPLEKWDVYMYSIPEKDEINRIYEAIREDRKQKTQRIRGGLSKIVGYREAKDFSRRSGVSDTIIRDIIEGKKEMAGYDIINRLELYLSATLPDFELSIENPLTVKLYSQEYLGKISDEIYKVANRLKNYCYELTEIARKQKLKCDWNGDEIPPANEIKYSINRLSELKDDIDIFWENYLKK